MGLLSDNTRWIFLLPNPAFHKIDERHIQDIAFGVKCLLKAGVDYENINIFIDNVSKILTDYIFSYFEIKSPDMIFPTSELENIMAGNKKKNAVVFVTGHGSEEGMFADVPIKPYRLYKIFLEAPCLENTVFYFGQCYAGIFNFMPLSKHLNMRGKFINDIVAIGATGFESSVSIRQQLPNEKVYDANIFLLNVYKWILEKKDIDGDGQLSVMDSFKYATIEVNKQLHNSEKQNLLQTVVSIETLLRTLQEKDKSAFSQDERLKFELEERTLQDSLEFYHINQQSWILSEETAMSVMF